MTEQIKPVCHANTAIECPCPKDCPRHGKCCACVAHHREKGKLPKCLAHIKGGAFSKLFGR